jgi:Dolichyl-phosphate-mannose-protein mannosyltransferase
LLLSAAAIAATVIMTWPLVTGLDHLGRTQNSGDARFAVWNVAWVAHALITDPGELYDANIFFPHRHTLAYSEANVGAGVLAVPAWVATRNPFIALNVVVLFGFAASVVATFLLARRLTGDGGAAATAAVLFAFCPYVFAHTAHIQLLMVAGIPLTMLMLHRLVDAPSPERGLALGAALAAQALSCAYYGIFAGLAVGYATLFYAWSRKYWKTSAYWLAIGIAAGISVGIVVPFFLPYLRIQEDTGFARSLDDARHWSAYWRSYLASGAHAHAWLLPLIRDWNNAVLFPGFVSIGLAACGAAVAWQRRPSDSMRVRDRETLLLYGSIGVLAFWASLGPRAGLYTLLYSSLPVFSFLRAPERMGIVVMLCLAVLSAYAVRALRQRFSGTASRAVAVGACGLALLELNDIPFDWRQDRVPAVYRVLARMPRGALAEFPFYDRRIDFHIHSRYMLFSTAHWQPLVNGYSDHIPADFRTLATTLASFPSRASFDALRERHARYISIHRGRQGYGAAGTAEIERRLQPYLQNLRPVADDGDIAIYEIVSWPR